MGFRWSKFSSIVGDDVGGLVPLGHDRVVLVLGRQEAHVVVLLDLLDSPSNRARISPLFGGMTTSFLETVMPARGEPEAEVLERVEHERDGGGAVGLDERVDRLTESFLRIGWLTNWYSDGSSVAERASSACSMRSL